MDHRSKIRAKTKISRRKQEKIFLNFIKPVFLRTKKTQNAIMKKVDKLDSIKLQTFALQNILKNQAPNWEELL